MRIVALSLTVLAAGFLAACGAAPSTAPASSSAPEMSSAPSENAPSATYQTITAEEAKQMMDENTGYVLLDVRTQEEFDEGHIAGAVLLPYDEISQRAESELPDKDTTILVYCRSGRRSAIAAQALADMGYTNVYDFGGIIDWPYEVER